MIDTDKYEGHEEGHQAWQELVKDAPLLLEEVKRLRGIIDYIRDTGRMVKPKRYSGFFLSIMEKVLTTEEYFEWR
tara:strand:- start:1077 stop:1301 length:225 start_codon:yes stop_codon:yes gene_type:complete